jgi:aromatic ring-opening dioxygenase catalytic subunit (LigB family)
VISVSVCQTATDEDFCAAVARSARRSPKSDRKVILLASGALSHTFYKLRELASTRLPTRATYFSEAARDADYERLDWFKARDHARCSRLCPAFHKVGPRRCFGHWL